MGDLTDNVCRRNLFINCDIGEGYGNWKMGPDEELMGLIDVANVACGFHGGDPSIMVKTVRLAKKHNVPVGAHPGLPDLQGFGRRILAITPEDLRASVLYQVGALVAILRSEGMELNHIKPHGALFLMLLKDRALCEAVMSVNKLFRVPVIGMKGTLQEEVAKKMGVLFIAEFFPDMQYDGEGSIIPLRFTERVSIRDIPKKVLQAVVDDTVVSDKGTVVKLNAGQGDMSFCVHSDLPGCIETAIAVRKGFEKVRQGHGSLKQASLL